MLEHAIKNAQVGYDIPGRNDDLVRRDMVSVLRLADEPPSIEQGRKIDVLTSDDTSPGVLESDDSPF